MYTISVEVIHKCNLNCKYCYLGKKNNIQISNETANAAILLGIEEAKKQKDKTLHIYFIGGEPLLNFEEIKKMVAYSKSVGQHNFIRTVFSITTNATLLNKEIIDFFISENFELKISLDGIKKSHDLNRYSYLGNGSYESIVSIIPLLRTYEAKTKKSVAVAHVITCNNVEFLFQNFIHLIELGFLVIESAVNKYENWDAPSRELLSKQMVEVMKTYISEKQKGSNIYWTFLERRIRNYYSYIPFFYCKAGLKSIFITVDGDIFPCSKTDSLLQIGSVNSGLKTSNIRELIAIQKTINRKCLDCGFLSHCTAQGCVVENYIHNGDFFDPVPIDCYTTTLIFSALENILSPEQKKVFQEYYSQRRKS